MIHCWPILAPVIQAAARPIRRVWHPHRVVVRHVAHHAPARVVRKAVTWKVVGIACATVPLASLLPAPALAPPVPGAVAPAGYIAPTPVPLGALPGSLSGSPPWFDSRTWDTWEGMPSHPWYVPTVVQIPYVQESEEEKRKRKLHHHKPIHAPEPSSLVVLMSASVALAAMRKKQ